MTAVIVTKTVRPIGPFLVQAVSCPCLAFWPATPFLDRPGLVNSRCGTHKGRLIAPGVMLPTPMLKIPTGRGPLAKVWTLKPLPLLPTRSKVPTFSEVVAPMRPTQNHSQRGWMPGCLPGNHQTQLRLCTGVSLPRLSIPLHTSTPR